MKSTIEDDVNDILGSMTLGELEGLAKLLGLDKESERDKLPDWYGIDGIKFIWHNEWADPEIEYKGRRCSCFVVEDTMWERFREDYPDISESEQEDKFKEYMKANEHEVKELCELALFGGNW